jgi:uncharacterized circularly permuted ATP-grasp superfamily protein
VYSDERGGERVFPFDLIPRVITADEWDRVERGLAQRVQALNLFLNDVYGKQAILQEDILPARLVLGSSGYLERLRGVTPPGGIYIHVAGIDLIRSPTGEFLVLEDNVRTPSGVSYVLENRGVMKRALPSVFKKLNVRSVDEYPTVLRDTLLESAPQAVRGSLSSLSMPPLSMSSLPPASQSGHSLHPGAPDSPVRAVVLTPGPFNSAYFEHSFLAGRMGCDLAYASDLFVRDEKVYLKTTAGPQQIHVIYRRIDDAFLDPEFFRPDSLLGVAGLVSAYAAGNVTLANALGNGVADDKAVYPYVPDMIRFYLSEEPVLGQVTTYNLSRKADLDYALDHLKELVVKAVDGSGGYGMLMGPSASESEIAEFAAKLRENPRGYIAQPRVELSAAPTWCETDVAPRRVDLRPFVLTGKKTWVLPGGLCRVALKPNSYVVNSSQGGGSKDTWVLAAGAT